MDDAMVGVFTVGQLDTLKRDPFLAQTGIAFFSGKINALKLRKLPWPNARAWRLRK